MELLATILTIIVFYLAAKHGSQMSDKEAEQSDKAYDDNPAFWPSNIDDFEEPGSANISSSQDKNSP